MADDIPKDLKENQREVLKKIDEAQEIIQSIFPIMPTWDIMNRERLQVSRDPEQVFNKSSPHKTGSQHHNEILSSLHQVTPEKTKYVWTLETARIQVESKPKPRTDQSFQLSLLQHRPCVLLDKETKKCFDYQGPRSSLFCALAVERLLRGYLREKKSAGEHNAQEDNAKMNNGKEKYADPIKSLEEKWLFLRNTVANEWIPSLNTTLSSITNDNQQTIICLKICWLMDLQGRSVSLKWPTGEFKGRLFQSVCDTDLRIVLLQGFWKGGQLFSKEFFIKDLYSDVTCEIEGTKLQYKALLERSV